MKKIKILFIMILILMICTPFVNAVTASAILVADKTSVKPGDTFTVALSAVCEEGISGLSTKINYDKSKLDIQSANAGNNFINMGSDNVNLDIMSNSLETIEQANIYNITFKVKEEAQAGEITISTDSVYIETEAAEESSINLNAATIKITIEEKQNIEDATDDYEETPEGENEQQITNEIQEEQKQEVDANQKEENKQKQEASTNSMPYTGTEDYLLIGIIGLVIIAFIGYSNYKKYKNI